MYGKSYNGIKYGAVWHICLAIIHCSSNCYINYVGNYAAFATAITKNIKKFN